MQWAGNDLKRILEIEELGRESKAYFQQVKEILNAKPRSDVTDKYVLELYPYDNPGISVKEARDSDRNRGLGIGIVNESTVALFRKGLLLKVKDNGVEENYVFIPEARYRRAKYG